MSDTYIPAIKRPRGRPKKDPKEKQDHMVRIYLTGDEFEKLESAGGVHWIRDRLEDEIFSE